MDCPCNAARSAVVRFSRVSARYQSVGMREWGRQPYLLGGGQARPVARVFPCLHDVTCGRGVSPFTCDMPLTAVAGRPARDWRQLSTQPGIKRRCSGKSRSKSGLDAETVGGLRRVQRRLRQLDRARGMDWELHPLGGRRARPVAGVFPGANDVSMSHLSPPGLTVAALYIRFSYVGVPQDACMRGTGDCYEIFHLFFALLKRVF